MLLAISTRVGKSVFFHFNPDLAYIYLQLGISALFFAGPSLYLYMKSVIIKPEELHPRFWLHYIVAACLVLGVGIAFPFSKHPDLWACYFIDAIYFQWLIYIILCIPFAYELLTKYRSIHIKSIDFWLLSIFLGNLIICLCYLTMYYTSYIAGALSFSFIFYLMIIFLIFRGKRKEVLQSTPQKYVNKKISNTEADEVIQKLNKVIQDESLFMNSKLKISDLAEHVQLSSHKLSQILNDNLGKNFSSYINDFRIEKAKKMLLEVENFSIDAIGQECGFHAKSSFYTAFKKITGLTPAQYKIQQKK